MGFDATRSEQTYNIGKVIKPATETGFTQSFCKLSLSLSSSPFLLALEPAGNLEFFCFLPLLQTNVWTDTAPAAIWSNVPCRGLL
jgi:hypothetical protein